MGSPRAHTQDGPEGWEHPRPRGQEDPPCPKTILPSYPGAQTIPRVIDAGLAPVERVQAAHTVPSGPGIRLVGVRAAIDIYKRQEAVYGPEEARRIACGVVDLISELWQEGRTARRARTGDCHLS